MKVKHIYKEYPKHDWELDENGEIDLWAWESGYHAGPRCIRCGETPCCYCKTEQEWNKGPCIIDEYVCPKCESPYISFPFLRFNYCPTCGEPLDWSDINEKH